MFKKLVAVLALLACVQAAEVTDMRGKRVSVPDQPSRVATISDGFVEGVMTHFGVQDKIKIIASWAFKRDYKYTYESKSGESYSLRGWNTMKYLHPWLNDLPCINSPQGNIIDFELLASQKPDLVILRVGDCTLRGDNAANMHKTFDLIEALGIPLVVLYSPSYYKNADLSSLKNEILVLGQVFSQQEKAESLANYLESIEQLIASRTKDVADKTRVLYIGLNKGAREKGGVGTVWGTDTAESYIIEHIANAKNAYEHKGASVLLSAEQLNAIDPDVIVLPTSNGYHPPRELMDSSYYSNLSELKAIKNKKVYAMPWSPMNCARRLEYPLDLLIIAKAAYPERFADIKVHEFALDLYKKLYGVSDEVAKALFSEQILDWTLEYDF